MDSPYVSQDKVGEITIYHFAQSHRQAVDDYLQQMAEPLLNAHINAGKVDEPIRIVVDVSQSGMFPVNYMFNHVKTLFAKHEKVPQYYIAFVVRDTGDAMLVQLVDSIAVGSFSNTRRVFTIDQMDDAIDWLNNT